MLIHHVLPGEIDGNTTWFYRQNPFEQQETLRQVAFKRQRWPTLEDGRNIRFPGHIYPHILPDGYVRLAFYEPLAEAILSYLQDEDIALHTEVLNLKSSQVACLNFLFPLRQDTRLASAVLQPFLPGLQEVTEIEFEYTGPPEVTQQLGEPGSGKRGQNRTSIDTAIFWNDQTGRRHITLVEWKYTERSYGACSAFQSASKEDRARCQSLNLARDLNPSRSCLLTTGGRYRSRHYWEYLSAAGISSNSYENVSGCPFQGPFYQLMRQFVLAACLRRLFFPVQVDVISIGFAGNTALKTLPPQLQPLATGEGKSTIEAWNNTLKGVPLMRHITVEEMVARLDQVGGVNQGWRDYLHERYNV